MTEATYSGQQMAEAFLAGIDFAAARESHECTLLLESLCAWLLHRFGPDSPEGQEATFRLAKARAALTAARSNHEG